MKKSEDEDSIPGVRGNSISSDEIPFKKYIFFCFRFKNCTFGHLESRFWTGTHLNCTLANLHSSGLCENIICDALWKHVKHCENNPIYWRCHFPWWPVNQIVPPLNHTKRKTLNHLKKTFPAPWYAFFETGSPCPDKCLASAVIPLEHFASAVIPLEHSASAVIPLSTLHNSSTTQAQPVKYFYASSLCRTFASYEPGLLYREPLKYISL